MRGRGVTGLVHLGVLLQTSLRINLGALGLGVLKVDMPRLEKPPSGEVGQAIVERPLHGLRVRGMGLLQGHDVEVDTRPKRLQRTVGPRVVVFLEMRLRVA